MYQNQSFEIVKTQWFKCTSFHNIPLAHMQNAHFEDCRNDIKIGISNPST